MHTTCPQLLWCISAALATGISSNPYLIASRLSWSSFYDINRLNELGNSLPFLLEFMRVPPAEVFNCTQVQGGSVVPPPFSLSNQLSALLAIEMPVRRLPY
jgi:hypothetical protein